MSGPMIPATAYETIAAILLAEADRLESAKDLEDEVEEEAAS